MHPTSISLKNWCRIYNLKNKIHLTVECHIIYMTGYTYLYILFLHFSRDWGFCLNKNSRKPSTYLSMYSCQSIVPTSNWNVFLSSELSWVSRCLTLSLRKRHWALVKYCRHVAALPNFIWTIFILKIEMLFRNNVQNGENLNYTLVFVQLRWKLNLGKLQEWSVLKIHG